MEDIGKALSHQLLADLHVAPCSSSTVDKCTLITDVAQLCGWVNHGFETHLWLGAVHCHESLRVFVGVGKGELAQLPLLLLMWGVFSDPGLHLRTEGS